MDKYYHEINGGPVNVLLPVPEENPEHTCRETTT